jgi:ribosome recycling factor
MQPGDYPHFEEKIAKTLEVLAHNYATIRAGRANAAVLDRISVDYYGTPTPIAQIASISTPEPRVLLISPWDASALKNIEKAIFASDLGITPTNDGRFIRLNFPQLTEERRRELTKLVHKFSEEAKVAVRNVRREEVELAKAQKKKSEITEDDLKLTEKDLQELTDKAIAEVDKLTEKKEKELMEV